MENQILELLKLVRSDSDFKNTGDFIDNSLLDSFDLITLITMLEEKYAIEIPASLIIPDNFRSIQSIVAMVERCQSR